MLRFMRLLLLLLLLPFFNHAQVSFSGKVVEEFTKKPIPYATIGLIKQNVGTNANEQGEFTFSCKQPGLDTLIISSIGYITIRLPVNELRVNNVLTLSVKEVQLRQVVIKNQWNYSEVGTYRGYQDYCFTSSGYQSQVAKKLTAPVANSLLQTIDVRTSKYQGGKSIFRVRVYDFDSITKGPGEELTDTSIQVNSKGRVTSINMTSYKIWLPRNDFFVSIEWLLIPYNEYRFSSKFEGRQKEQLNYNPCICFTKDVQSKPVEIWGLAYSGNWYTQKHANGLAISATVMY